MGYATSDCVCVCVCARMKNTITLALSIPSGGFVVKLLSYGIVTKPKVNYKI